MRLNEASDMNVRLREAVEELERRLATSYDQMRDVTITAVKSVKGEKLEYSDLEIIKTSVPCLKPQQNVKFLNI